MSYSRFSFRWFIDQLGALFVLILTLAIALIPFWGWLAMYFLMEPVGFWQKALVFGVGAWLLGTFQVILLIFWIITTIKVFFTDP